MKERLLSYVVVRRDLTPAQQTVQACHAAMEMGIWVGVNENSPNPISPDTDGIHVALLGVENQDELMKLVKKISCDGILFQLFNEPDDSMGYTALCTAPSYKRNNTLSKLRLL